jgi:hypothetical protein
MRRQREPVKNKIIMNERILNQEKKISIQKIKNNKKKIQTFVKGFKTKILFEDNKHSSYSLATPYNQVQFGRFVCQKSI